MSIENIISAKEWRKKTITDILNSIDIALRVVNDIVENKPLTKREKKTLVLWFSDFIVQLSKMIRLLETKPLSIEQEHL
ncbi:MAG: hypothetical protein QXM27_02810 [Candidatus Pacearchaeota archaeon]